MVSLPNDERRERKVFVIILKILNENKIRRNNKLEEQNADKNINK